MNYKYEIIHTASENEREDHLPFGIKVVDENGDIVSIATDISADKEKICKLAELCNKLELAPIHFYEVICDFLTSESMLA